MRVGFHLPRTNTSRQSPQCKVLLEYLDFWESNKGKTSGSRVVFTNELHGNIMLHKPHSQKELKKYQIKQLKEFLEQEDLI